MDPRQLTPELWDQISRALVNLVFFAGLAVNAALALLLSHAIIPSLAANADVEMPRSVQAIRWILYPVFAASLILALLLLSRAVYLAVAVLQQFYPRFSI